MKVKLRTLYTSEAKKKRRTDQFITYVYFCLIRIHKKKKIKTIKKYKIKNCIINNNFLEVIIIKIKLILLK